LLEGEVTVTLNERNRMKFEAGDLVGFPVRMEFKEDVFTQAVSIIDLMVKLDTSLLVKLTA